MKTNLLKMKILRSVLIISLSLVACFSCSKKDGIEEQIIEEEESEKINQELMQLQSFSQPDEISSPELLEEEEPKKDEEFECVVRKFKAAPGYDEMLALDPTSDVIYPGAMLKGESIPTGEYIGINGGRAPITLSISLENIEGTASVDIENPELSEVRNGVKSLLAQGVTGATPAEIVYETEEVYSEEHLKIALGANYRSKNKSVSASFDFSNSEYRYRYVLKYLQVYYTIDMDLPTNDDPGSLFTVLPNLDGTSPVMVSSVKYGRMVLYTIESNANKSDVELAFNASFKSANAEGNVKYQSIINSSSIKALVIGGSGGDAAKVVTGPSGVYDYITKGGNYSADSPGAALAYTLRYIKEDFPIARVVLASEYSARNCDLAFPKYKITIKQIARTKGKAEKEIFGNIKARIKIGNKYLKKELLWEKTGKQNVGVDPGTPKSINQSVTFELTRPNYEEDEIYLSAHLKDYNGFGTYDDLDSDNEKIVLEDIDVHTSPMYINLDKNGKSNNELDPYTHILDGFEDDMVVTYIVERIK